MAKGPGNRGVIVAAEVAERDASRVREFLAIWATGPDRVGTLFEPPRKPRTKASAAVDQETDEAAEGPAAVESDGAGG